MITLASLRAHLVSAFEPDVCIIGNTTRQEIVEAIDVALAEAERLRAQSIADLRELNALRTATITTCRGDLHVFGGDCGNYCRCRRTTERR